MKYLFSSLFLAVGLALGGTAYAAPPLIGFDGKFVVDCDWLDDNFRYEYDKSYGDLSLVEYIGKGKELVFPDSVRIDGKTCAISSWDCSFFTKGKNRSIVSIVFPAYLNLDSPYEPWYINSWKGYCFSFDCPKVEALSFSSEFQFGNYIFLLGSFPRLKEIIVRKENVKYLCEKGILYSEDKKRIIKNITKPKGELIIPEGVVSIENGVFSGCSSITSVKFPQSLKRIGEGAFRSCSGLTHVVIPEEVDSIGKMAFSHCDGLVSVVFPDREVSMEYGAFGACKHLNLKFPKMLKNVGDYLPGCDSLKVIEIPEGVDSIRYNAFNSCHSLSVLKLPKSLRNVESCWYSPRSLSLLTDLHIDGGNPSYVSVDGVAYTRDTSELCFCPRGKRGRLVVPDGVKKIRSGVFLSNYALTDIVLPEGVDTLEDGAFKSCVSLKTVTLPQSLKYIGDEAFEKCLDLKSVEIPDGVDTIGDDVFGRCRSLTDVKLPQTLQFIGKRAFVDCPQLLSIEIPEGVDSIGDGAFVRCKSLTDVKLPQTLKRIGESAFGDCSQLLSIEVPEGVDVLESFVFSNCSSLVRVKLPQSLKRIGYDAFYKCKAMTSIEIPAGVEEIDPHAFDGCESLVAIHVDAKNKSYVSMDGVVYSKGMTTLCLCPEGKSNALGLAEEKMDIDSCHGATKVVVPEGTESIRECEFADCGTLRSVTFPSSLRSIGKSAFCRSGLTSIEIPIGVDSIMDYAFSECKNLVSVTLPDSLKYIGFGAFNGCKNLVSVRIPASVSELGNMFRGCEKLTDVQIDSSNRNYKCVDGIVFTKDMTQLCICPAGKTGRIVVPKGVTKIAEYAFDSCVGLTDVELPQSLKYIDWSAFEGCSGLSSIEIPEGVKMIDWNVFLGCTALKRVKLPKSLSYLKIGAFSGCKELSYIKIPKNVYAVDLDFAPFEEPNNLTIRVDARNPYYTVEDDILYWQWAGEKVLLYCPRNKAGKVVVPEGVTLIGDEAFSGCGLITEIKLPNSLCFIRCSAFQNCGGLTDIVIPEKVWAIERYAFCGCKSLKSVTLLPKSMSLSDCGVFVKCHPQLVVKMHISGKGDYRRLLGDVKIDYYGDK